MKFKKYTEIENYNNKFIQLFDEHIINDSEWVALNKVDGSNFSIWYDRDETRYAKRSCMIADDSNFGNSNNVMKNYEQAIMNVYNHIKQPFSIYGEICGGYYPHTEVERVKDAQRIQGRVSYCPHNDFIGFDIYLPDTNEYMNWDDVKCILVSSGFKVVDEIARGSFDTMLNLNVHFADPTYKQFGLPEIEDNFSEGVVIKPLKEKRLDNGCRVIIKKKSEKFSEKKHAKTETVEVVLSDIEQNALNIMVSLITESRYYSVISKITTEPTFKLFSQIQKEFCHDVLNDLEKELSVNIYEMENHKILLKKLGEECAKIVRQELMKVN